jgi:chromosome segregation ATPase
MNDYDNDIRWRERIEDKIDQLSEAMITLARAEEKLVSIERNNQSVQMRLDRQAEKIENLEKLVADNNRTVTIVNRIFWLIVTAIIVSIFSFKIL